MTEQDNTDAEKVQERVRQAVAAGENITREVEQVAREALQTGQLEFARMQRIIESIGRGASAGASEQPDEARSRVNEAFEGLQNAMLHTFESARLATAEQAARAEKFYEQDLKTRLSELRQMESAMLDSLAAAAKSGSDAGTAALDDLVKHARRTGTRLGDEVEDSMRKLASSLPAALKETALAGFGAAREVTARAAEVASGVLSSVAEQLHTRDAGKDDKKDGSDDSQH